MASFKVGDKVVRVGRDNEDDGACIGTVAIVTGVGEDGFVSVYYPGCFDDEDGSEIWHPRFAELVQEPQHDPVTTVDLHDAYLALQEACGIKAGDTVRVLREAEDGEMGWSDDWAPWMDECVGMTGVVEGFRGSGGIRVQFPDGEGWNFPFFVLEKIADAPRFITINGHRVPEPVREPLRREERYWIVAIGSSNFCVAHDWRGGEFDRRLLQRGLIHKTSEAAEIHAKALLSFMAKSED